MNRLISRLLALLATTQIGAATGAEASTSALTLDEEASVEPEIYLINPQGDGPDFIPSSIMIAYA